MQADEVNPEAPELVEGVDEGAGGAGEAGVAEHHHNVHLALPDGFEELLVAGAVLGAARGVVKRFTGDGKAAPSGLLAALPELRFGVLVLILGRNRGVEGGAFHCRQYNIFRNELLYERRFEVNEGVDFAGKKGAWPAQRCGANTLRATIVGN